MLSVAQDLANSIAPYQAALTSALNTATQLPLVGRQLTDLSEFTTVLQNLESNIAPQTQSIVNDGHYQITVGLPALAKTFSFNLGLDAFLQASVAGNVQVSINPTLYVGFDYSGGDVSLDLGQTRFDIGFGISLPGFQGTFSFNGLLFAKAVDQGTNFNGVLGFGFASGGGLSPQFSGNAHVLMGLSLSFVDPALDASFNPVFRTTLDMNWGFGANNQLATPSIQLVNMGLEADSFLDGFLGDVVKTVQKFTKPIQPLIDIFQTPVPIVSSFGSHETIGSLLQKGAGVSQELQDRFDLLMQIITAVNTIDLSGGAGGAVIPLGTVSITGNAQQSGAFGFNTSQITAAIDDIFNSPALQAVEDALRDFGNYTGFASQVGFQFPLLENPGPVLGAILTGQTETMFSFTTGRQHFELAPSLGVGVKDLFGVFLTAGIIFDAKLTMGYDTAGLVALAQDPNHDPARLLHGFYFDNSIDATAPPIPNHSPLRQTGLYMQGLMELSASAGVTISGGLYANIDVELVNTDASNHVHLDTMLANLISSGRVFKPTGKVYASADFSLSLPNPVGPDITLFSYNLGYDELVNFDPPPPPNFGVPVTVIDVTNQHTLLLDVNKMATGSRAVTVQPFHDLSLTSGGNTFEADGIRVDYPSEIYFFVERKNDLTTNYYNLVGLSGAAPDGISVNIIDPFRVFVDEGAPNPVPTQTNEGVLLAGGRNVLYKYTEVADGTAPNVLLAGGYGSNTLSGGSMIFGNFIPADRIAQAKSHFGNLSGYDAIGQGLVNSVIDAVIAPASPAGIIGSTMTGTRGGLMFGGPGNNSFFATGAGAYEMVGGTWVDSFSISPSFSGGTASYQIDGGPGGDNGLAVRVPAGDLADFENGTVPDRYDPAYKALDIFSNAGLFATAHGIQKVVAIGAAGSTIIFGDTSELNIDFKVFGSAAVKFGGSPAPDDFSVTAQYSFPFFYATEDRHLGPALIPANINGPPNIQDFDNGLAGFTLEELPYGYLDGPILSITRTFGTNGRTQIIPFSVADSDQSSITLDGRGASDDYTIDIGVGTFLDLAVDDSDVTNQNALTVEFNQPLDFLGGTSATLTDTSLQLEYYTPILSVSVNVGAPTTHFYRTSVFYSPMVSFTANVDIVFETIDAFDEFIVNRPLAPQDAEIRIKTSALYFPYYAYDPSQPSATLISLDSTYISIDVQANGGSLLISKAFDINETPARRHYDVTIHTNNGQLTVDIDGIWSGYVGTGSIDFPELVHVLSNAGTINLSHTVTVGPSTPYIGPVQLLDIRSNAGTINVFDAIAGYSGFNWGYPGIDNQVTLGTGGNLAGVHGTINFSNSLGHLGLTLDDRNTPGAISPWTIDRDRTVIGDLTLNYPGLNANGTDGYSKLVVYPKAGSTVVKSAEPRFFIREYHFESANLHTLNFSPPSFQNHKDGNTVSLTLSATTDLGLPITYSATNLPPGLSINPTTGVISGTISNNAYLGSPYQTTVTATAGAFACLRNMPWSVTSGINISFPSTFNLVGHEGVTTSFGPFTTTNVYNLPVTLNFTGLPPGLSYNPNTGMVSGTVAVGAATNAPSNFTYQVTVQATDGTETATRQFNWKVSAINLIKPPIQNDHVGDSINLSIQATTPSAGPIVFSAQDLPPGLSINENTGAITGTLSNGADADSPYFVTVTASVGTDIQAVEFFWSVLPVGVDNQLSLANPGNQSHQEGQNGIVSFVVTNSLGLPLEYTVQGLPPGSKLNQSYFGSAFINGIIQAGAGLASPYHVVVTATDGATTAQINFDWSVLTSPVGDYSGNHIVDAADYVLWRKYGVNQSQYNVWRANFGAIVGSGAESGTDEPILGQSSTISESASAQVTENVPTNESQPISATPSRAVNGLLDFEFDDSVPFASLFGVRSQRIAMHVARSAIARHDDGLLAWLSSQSLPNSDNTSDDEFFGAIHYNGDESSEFRFDTFENALDKLLVGDPESW